MPEDAPGMGISTAVPALPLPAPPDRAAQPGASSVGRMVQHTPAPGQPPTTCQSLGSCSTTQGTQCRMEAGNHSPLRATAATGGLAQAHLQGSLGRKETSQPHSHYLAPLTIPPMTVCLLINPALGPERQAHILLPRGRRALAPPRPREEPGLQLEHPGCGDSRRARWPCVLS